MNPVNRPNAHLDAIYLSPHKFVGGPGASGVLIVKRALMTNRVPTVAGGGTVTFVWEEGHGYDAAPEAREEGGTPGARGGARPCCALLAGLMHRPPPRHPAVHPRGPGLPAEADGGSPAHRGA